MQGNGARGPHSSVHSPSHLLPPPPCSPFLPLACAGSASAWRSASRPLSPSARSTPGCARWSHPSATAPVARREQSAQYDGAERAVEKTRQQRAAAHAAGVFSPKHTKGTPRSPPTSSIVAGLKQLQEEEDHRSAQTLAAPQTSTSATRGASSHSTHAAATSARTSRRSPSLPLPLPHPLSLSLCTTHSSSNRRRSRAAAFSSSPLCLLSCPWLLRSPTPRTPYQRPCHLHRRTRRTQGRHAGRDSALPCACSSSGTRPPAPHPLHFPLHCSKSLSSAPMHKMTSPLYFSSSN